MSGRQNGLNSRLVLKTSAGAVDSCRSQSSDDLREHNARMRITYVTANAIVRGPLLLERELVACRRCGVKGSMTSRIIHSEMFIDEIVTSATSSSKVSAGKPHRSFWLRQTSSRGITKTGARRPRMIQLLVSLRAVAFGDDGRYVVV